jgi:uncharacterized membrane protein
VSSLLLVLLGLALLEALMSPVLFGAVTWALGSRHPYRTALLLLAGFISVLAVVGSLLSPVFRWLRERITGPEGAADFAVGVGVGAVIMIVAVLYGRGRRRAYEPDHALRWWEAIWSGMQVGFFGTPFALPFFASLDRIVQARLPYLVGASYVAFFLAVFATPFTLLVLARFVLHEQSDALFRRVNGFIGRASRTIVPLLLLALGALLVADGVGHMLGSPILPPG